MAKKPAQERPRDADGRLIVDGYARMSVGLDGKEENVENQLDDIRAIIERNGWVAGELHKDGESAWKRGVRRPGWDTLIERMKAGQTGGVVVWHQDRLMRQPRDLETLLDIAEEREVELASVHGRRNLRDPDDRFIMRIEVGHACRSSDDTSRRAVRKNDGRRARGLLVDGGPRPFAWHREGADKELVKREQEALRKAFKDVAKGVSLQTIATRWNKADLRAYYGNDWCPKTVHQTMSKGRYAGRIVHEGEFMGNIADHEPTVTPELFDRVQALFASRAIGRPRGKTSLGSGIVGCSKCGTHLVSRPQYRRGHTFPSYRCAKSKGGCGGISIGQEPVDLVLREIVIKRLSDPAIAERVAAIQSGQKAEVEDLLDQLETLRQAEKGLAARAKGMGYEAYFAVQDQINSDIKAVEGKLEAARAAALDVEAAQTQSALAVAKEWDASRAAGDNERARQMLRSALAMDRVVILPAPENRRIGAKVATERVKVELCGTANNTFAPAA